MIKPANHSATIEAIRNCIGKSVLGISRIQYYFNDEENQDGFGDLEISVSDDLFLTLTRHGDAESIKAKNIRATTYESFYVNEVDVASWKRLDLTSEQEWRNLIGQKLKSAEVEWNLYETIEDRITACVLHFEKDFLTFYETGSDETKFYLNTELPLVNIPTRTEVITNVC